MSKKLKIVTAIALCFLLAGQIAAIAFASQTTMVIDNLIVECLGGQLYRNDDGVKFTGTHCVLKFDFPVRMAATLAPIEPTAYPTQETYPYP